MRMPCIPELPPQWISARNDRPGGVKKSTNTSVMKPPFSRWITWFFRDCLKKKNIPPLQEFCLFYQSFKFWDVNLKEFLKVAVKKKKRPCWNSWQCVRLATPRGDAQPWGAIGDTDRRNWRHDVTGAWSPNWLTMVILLMAEIPNNQLRLVVYPIIYRVSYIQGGAGFQPSTALWNHGRWRMGKIFHWLWEEG